MLVMTATADLYDFVTRSSDPSLISAPLIQAADNRVSAALANLACAVFIYVAVCG